MVHLSSIFNTPRGVQDLNVVKYLFFRVPFLMASGGGGLVELQCGLFCIFRFRVHICLSFPALSEALRVGTWRNILSSAFQFSWPRIVVDWMNSNVFTLSIAAAMSCSVSAQCCVVAIVVLSPTPPEALRVGM